MMVSKCIIVNIAGDGVIIIIILVIVIIVIVIIELYIMESILYSCLCTQGLFDA